MLKRITAALLIAVCVFSLTGCAAIYNKQYVSVTDYTQDSGEEGEGQTRLISDFGELKNALVSAVSLHLDQDRYKFVNYDGNLKNDLAEACDYVLNQTAIGCYAAENISSDLSRIITYYEATVYITYKKTIEEISAISYVSGKSALPEGILTALEALDTDAVFSLNSSTLTADDVTWAVFLALAEKPDSCVVLPASEVKIYPETGSTRIVELSLSYGYTDEEIDSMRKELIKTAESIINTYGKSPVTLLRALKETCTPSSEGENVGNAYGALVQKTADSSGLALGFKTLCDTAGVQCAVVTGTMRGEYHCWNALLSGGEYVYADASADGTGGLFGVSGAELKGMGYEWDEAPYQPAPAVQQ